jgi:hypothetical protein
MADRSASVELNTRGRMAVFLVKTFGLLLYGPQAVRRWKLRAPRRAF